MAEQQPNGTEDNTPTSPALSTVSAKRTSFQSHSRALSKAHEPNPGRTNRFSVQFPIQPSQLSGSCSPARLASPVRESLRGTPDLDQAASDPSDGNYLHLIAAQERRVLELKEELQKAEADLNKLKRDWARHEANKKRDDVKRLTKLQSLQTSLPPSDREDDSDGSSAWMHQEMERRRAIMSATKSSNRTVFSGQRHARALSLLSPKEAGGAGVSVSSAPPRPPPRKDSLKNATRHSLEQQAVAERPPLLSRASTTSDMLKDANADGAQQSIDHAELLRAGKKVATDFKDGLWTFWEDLRQATVGEDSHPIQPPRRKSSTQTLKAAGRNGSKTSLRDTSKRSPAIGEDSGESRRPSPARKKSTTALPDLADPTFWNEHGISSPETTRAPTKKTPASKQAKLAEQSKRSSTMSEHWEWDDSPVQSRSSSSITSDTVTLPSTVSGSPRTSLSANKDPAEPSKKESIPWPVIKKSGLGSLRRTASHLLTEWEKSLTPSPGEEYTGQEDYLGASAEAAAYGANRTKHD